MHRKTRVEIYIERIKNNLSKIKKNADAKKLCMMVKANAYGHGLVPVARALQNNVDSFGIISIEEGHELRQAGIQTPIWLFSNLWADSPVQLKKNNIIPVIGDFASLNNLFSYEEEIEFHIKLNTGMNRFGFRLEQIVELNEMFDKYSRKPSFIATHMLDGNQFDQEISTSAKQLASFEKMLEALNFKANSYHLYKSAPTLLSKPAGLNPVMLDCIRPGIACYGSFPEESFPRYLSLEPAMELKTVILSFQEIKKGESVSYSGTWTAKQDSLIGVCQIGYADGLSRLLSNKIEMLVAEQRVPQVGNICMDYCMLDLTKVRGQVSIGDEVVVFGRQGDKVIRVEELATLGKTIPYEILTSIAPRVKRQYVEDEAESR